jgi:hypothetical protein
MAGDSIVRPIDWRGNPVLFPASTTHRGPRRALQRSGLRQGLPIRVAAHFNTMRIAHDAVEDAVGESRIASPPILGPRDRRPEHLADRRADLAETYRLRASSAWELSEWQSVAL